MKLCISLGNFDLKYFFYCISFLILQLYLNFFIYYDDDNDDDNNDDIDNNTKKDKNIINTHKLLDLSCFFLGFLLNIIPALISNKISKVKQIPKTRELEVENKQSFQYIYNEPLNEYL